MINQPDAGQKSGAFARSARPNERIRGYACPVLEGFEMTLATEMDIDFDFGDLGMLVVRVDGQGRGQEVFFA